MWHVSSRSGVATLRTATHLLLTYLLTYLPVPRTRTPILAILYDHVIMYVGLFGYSAVVFRVFLFY